MFKQMSASVQIVSGQKIVSVAGATKSTLGGEGRIQEAIVINPPRPNRYD
jgi:hypothetical protein